MECGVAAGGFGVFSFQHSPIREIEENLTTLTPRPVAGVNWQTSLPGFSVYLQVQYRKEQESLSERRRGRQLSCGVTSKWRAPPFKLNKSLLFENSLVLLKRISVTPIVIVPRVLLSGTQVSNSDRRRL